MQTYLGYLYLISPLHTGGTTQEGNLLGIARESHTDLPYLPSSTIRGRLRATTPDSDRTQLWGNSLEDITAKIATNLEQGALWVGDGAILWFPIPSLSHGVVWITSQFLLRRWLRFTSKNIPLPAVGSFSDGNKSKNLYLKDAIFQAAELRPWAKEQWMQYIPTGNNEAEAIAQVLVLKDQDAQVLIQASLWRQVKIKLNEQKNVNGGFRYEEAIPPETLMYFPWGTNAATNGQGTNASNTLKQLLQERQILQLGGQESLGRGFVELWHN